MTKILRWFDEYALLVLSLFLVMLIPLWPKIPLLQPIPGYIVRIRLEDIFVGITGVVFLVQLLRRRVSLQTPLTWSMLMYLGVGFVSLVSAFFLVKSLPVETPHVGKAFLHLFRYIEYFSLFFFVYFSIRKLADVRWFIAALCVVVLGISLYGIGQKYWKWPVYSTMNYEFSAGTPLELVNPQSRVQSTFAGHYDFAIYVNILLPILLALLFTKPVKNKSLIFPHLSTKQEKVFFGVIFILALWCLIVSGLRSAFASYVVMAGVLTSLYAWQQHGWHQRVTWFITRLTIIGIVTMVMFALFGNNLQALLNHALGGLLPGIFAETKPSTIDETIIDQYQLPVPKDQVEQYLQQGGTKPAQLSGCALEKEISLCIRLESLWPQAMAGFAKQPLMGSGYSSLNKRDFNHLSEADGTDNNFLRMLGETGALGLVSFLTIIVMAARTTINSLNTVMQLKKQTELNTLQLALGLAFLTAIVGILLNAVLFDVFSASKVAFGFWAVTGLCLGTAKLALPNQSR